MDKIGKAVVKMASKSLRIARPASAYAGSSEMAVFGRRATLMTRQSTISVPSYLSRGARSISTSVLGEKKFDVKANNGLKKGIYVAAPTGIEIDNPRIIEQMQEDINSKIPTMPASQIYIVSEYPSYIKEMNVERSLTLMKQGGINSVLDPRILMDWGDELEKAIKDGVARGDKNAARMQEAYEGLVTGKYTHVFFADGMPHTPGFSIESEFLYRVAIDNTITSREQTLEAIGENMADILHAFAIHQKMGYGFPSWHKSMYCYRTTSREYPHVPSAVRNTRDRMMTTLHAIYSDGSITNIVVDFRQLWHFLTPREKELAQEPVWYLSDRPSENGDLADKFSMIEIISGRPKIRFNANGGLMAHSASSKSGGKFADFEMLSFKISLITAMLLDRELITAIQMQTGDTFMINGRETVIARTDTGQGLPLDNPKNAGEVKLRTSTEQERRMMQLISDTDVPRRPQTR